MVSSNTVFAYRHNLFPNCGVSRVAIVTWLQAGVDWVFIIFEIMSETVKSCFITWTKKKTDSSWLIMSPIVNAHVIYMSFFSGKICNTQCSQQTLQLMEQMTTFTMFKTIFSWTTTYTHLFSAVYHCYWILMLFLCQSVGQIYRCWPPWCLIDWLQHWCSLNLLTLPFSARVEPKYSHSMLNWRDLWY